MEGRWKVIWIEVHKGTCLYLEDILVYILLPFLFGVTSVARIFGLSTVEGAKMSMIPRHTTEISHASISLPSVFFNNQLKKTDCKRFNSQPEKEDYENNYLVRCILKLTSRLTPFSPLNLAR